MGHHRVLRDGQTPGDVRCRRASRDELQHRQLARRVCVALGAPRGEISKQCLVEAGTVGLAGGVLGLLLSLLGLWAVRQQPMSYAKLAHLDLSMLLTTFALAIAASLIAGLLPAWRAMQVTPAIQLKSQ